MHELYAETTAEKDAWILELCRVIEAKMAHIRELTEGIERARKLRQDMASAQAEATDGNVVRMPLPLHDVQVNDNPSGEAGGRGGGWRGGQFGFALGARFRSALRPPRVSCVGRRWLAAADRPNPA